MQEIKAEVFLVALFRDIFNLRIEITSNRRSRSDVGGLTRHISRQLAIAPWLLSL